MIAGTAASTDYLVYEEEFVCCIWMMFVRKSNWKTLTIKYRTTSGRQWDAT